MNHIVTEIITSCALLASALIAVDYRVFRYQRPLRRRNAELTAIILLCCAALLLQLAAIGIDLRTLTIVNL